MSLTFRRVRLSDLWTLYAWRLEQQTAYWSLGGAPSISQHQAWMHKAIVDEDIYLAEDGDTPAAVFEVCDTEVSITVNPLRRRLGTARECLKFLQGRYTRLDAAVIVGNTAGLRLFVSAGFVITGADYVKHRPCVSLTWEKV